MENKNPARLFSAKYWELIFFFGYSLVLFIIVIPGLKWDFDVHDAALLMTSVRIRAGQVPFRDFYPWYGPLYHYLLALFTGILGNDLYAVKAYIDLVSPLLSLAVLIFTLRNFGLTASSRVFTLLASVFLGLERIYYCGSLRAFLPVCVISLLYRAFQRGQKPPYLFIFPAASILFFFSPESGIYTMLTSVFFVLAAASGLFSRRETMAGALYFAAGAGISALAAIVLFYRTGWFANYLEFVSVVSNNLYWSYGSSMSNFHEHPELLSIFMIPMIYIAALAAVSIQWAQKQKPGQYSLLVLTLTFMGVFLFSRACIQFQEIHLQFAFLPALIIAGLLWAAPLRPIRAWKIAIQILLVLFLSIARMIIVPYWHFPPPKLYGRDYKVMIGVRVNPELAEIYQKIQELYRELGLSGSVGIPLTDAEYAYLEKAPEFPFDNLYYNFHPKYQRLFIEALKKNNFDFLIVNDKDVAWNYTQDSLDSLYDYIDGNYRQIPSTPPLHVYQLRKNPIKNIITVIEKEDGPFILDKDNRFSINLRAPSGLNPTFVEFNTNFKYRYRFLSRFSMPMVELDFDRVRWHFQVQESSSKRISPLEGEHYYRAYLRYPANAIDLQFSFPGMFNFRPEKIIVSDVRWCEFSLEGSPSMRQIVSYKLDQPVSGKRFWQGLRQIFIHRPSGRLHGAGNWKW